jgi:hypothetical protein
MARVVRRLLNGLRVVSYCSAKRKRSQKHQAVRAPKQKTPDSRKKSGVLFASNMAVKERFELLHPVDP